MIRPLLCSILAGAGVLMGCPPYSYGQDLTLDCTYSVGGTSDVDRVRVWLNSPRITLGGDARGISSVSITDDSITFVHTHPYNQASFEYYIKRITGEYLWFDLPNHNTVVRGACAKATNAF
jgi:hypothetical protein